MEPDKLRFLSRKGKLLALVREEIIEEWLCKPNSGFGGKTPLEVSDEEFSRMIYLLKSGDPS